MAVNAKNITDDEFFFGHKACAGCGGSLAVRAALKVLGPNAVCALPAGCMSAVGFNFPQLSFANNAMITPFAATASVLTGIEAGLRAQGKKPDDCTVVGFAGDGGTADIGSQALSGAIDRNDDVLYICYAVASVFVVVAALQIYIKMNTGEDGVVKSIVSLVGACLFIIGASIVFPAFFGYRI